MVISLLFDFFEQTAPHVPGKPGNNIHWQVGRRINAGEERDRNITDDDKNQRKNQSRADNFIGAP